MEVHKAKTGETHRTQPGPAQVPSNRIKMTNTILRPVFGERVKDAKQLFKGTASSRTPCTHLHWAVGPRIVGPVDGGGCAKERAAAADFWRGRVVASKLFDVADADRAAPGYVPRAVFANRPCDGGAKVAMRCVRPDAVARLVAAFKAHGVDLAACCPWHDEAATARRFAEADLVVGPHGAGLANAMLARNGLVLVEIHGDFGSEQDLFRKVADARRGAARGRRTVEARSRGSLRISPQEALRR